MSGKLRTIGLSVVALALIVVFSGVGIAFGADGNWYRGNIHAHSLWSDGNTFPELVAEEYRSLGYDFLALTEHNILARGERWKDVTNTEKHAVSEQAMKKYRDRFGNDWVETRKRGGKLQVRLKTLDEVRKLVEEPGRFILIQGEEITGKFQDRAVHVSAINVVKAIQPQRGSTMVDTIQRDAMAVFGQSLQTKRPMVAVVNHPNWPTYDIAAWELAAAKYVRLVEFGNAAGDCLFYGDADHPGMERVWDLANTIRISNLKAAPLFGVAADDAHTYPLAASEPSEAGKAWIVVRADELTPKAVVESIGRGDFYASTGVKLRDVKYDAKQRTLTVEIHPEPGVHYVTEFIGTMEGYDRSSKIIEVQGRRPHRVRRYSDDIGKVLLRAKGTKTVYRLTGKELFVRATVRSDKPMDNPTKDGMQKQEAWTQPVAWEDRIR
jgi:hypothetical protein